MGCMFDECHMKDDEDRVNKMCMINARPGGKMRTWVRFPHWQVAMLQSSKLVGAFQLPLRNKLP